MSVSYGGSYGPRVSLSSPAGEDSLRSLRTSRKSRFLKSPGSADPARQLKFLQDKGDLPPPNRLQRLRLQIWWTFENPTSSRGAKVLSATLILAIVVSIVNFMVGSWDRGWDGFPGCRWWDAYNQNASAAAYIEQVLFLTAPRIECQGLRVESYDWAQAIETTCIMIFTAEYVLRLCTCTTVIPLWR